VEGTKTFTDHPLSEESRDLSMCSRNMISIFFPFLVVRLYFSHVDLPVT
jgi:hypothetical protein